MKSMSFNGNKFEVPENIADYSLTEEQLRQKFNVPDDELMYISGQGQSKVVKGNIRLQEGMEMGSVSSFVPA